MERSIRLWHWLPRVLCIAAILFISIFALDAFEPGLPLEKQLTGFFIHLIPSFILLAILLLSWKRELIGGVLFIVISVVLTPVVFMMNYQRNHSFWMSLLIILMITVPFLVTGILFVVSHRKKRAFSK